MPFVKIELRDGIGIGRDHGQEEQRSTSAHSFGSSSSNQVRSVVDKPGLSPIFPGNNLDWPARRPPTRQLHKVIPNADKPVQRLWNVPRHGPSLPHGNPERYLGRRSRLENPASRSASAQTLCHRVIIPIHDLCKGGRPRWLRSMRRCPGARKVN